MPLSVNWLTHVIGTGFLTTPGHHAVRRHTVRRLYGDDAAADDRGLGEVADRGLGQKPIGEDDLDPVVGQDLGRAPVDLRHTADRGLRRALDLYPIADLKRPLHLDGQAGKEVPESLLQGQADDRGQEGRGGEQRAQCDTRFAEGHEGHAEVDQRLHDVADDARQRAPETVADQPLDQEQERGAAET
jgi:hypothetical protein